MHQSCSPFYTIIVSAFVTYQRAKRLMTDQHTKSYSDIWIQGWTSFATTLKNPPRKVMKIWTSGQSDYWKPLPIYWMWRQQMSHTNTSASPIKTWCCFLAWCRLLRRANIRSQTCCRCSPPLRQPVSEKEVLKWVKWSAFRRISAWTSQQTKTPLLVTSHWGWDVKDIVMLSLDYRGSMLIRHTGR